MPKHADEADPKPGPALEEGIIRLAVTLYEHVHGKDTWRELDEEYEEDVDLITNYTADARELAELMPHLLSGYERGIDVQ